VCLGGGGSNNSNGKKKRKREGRDDVRLESAAIFVFPS
jgi:hypothetical protein